jgi:mono/diheme cytochrome c family protein
MCRKIARKMARKTALICALWCLGMAACNKPPADYAIPPEEASRPNPFPMSPENIAAGKKAYDDTDCALCHGASGNGKGVLARDMKYNTRDWRDPATLKNFTDGELFYILNKGKRAMPSYQDREPPDHLWQMVDYVRSLAKH